MAGTLRGVRGLVDVPPSTDRSMSPYIAGTLSVGTDESYSDGEPVDAVELVTLSGVPGYGALVTGFAPPTTTHVIATTAGGDIARVPVAQRANASVFAVPIPDTVAVSALTFLAADGSVVATLEIPDLPFGFGGGLSIGESDWHRCASNTASCALTPKGASVTFINLDDASSF